MTRTLVIGDVHGCLESLDELLSLAEVRPGDRVISVGDLIHRGPDSVGVVRRMREFGAELALGNHERQQARFRKAMAACNGNLSKVDMKKKEILVETEESFSPEDVAYLESARLFINVPGGLVVHAGILPAMKHIPSEDEIAALSKREREKLERVIRVRFVRGKPDVRVTMEFQCSEDFPLSSGEMAPSDADLVDYLARCDSATVIQKIVHERGEFLPLGEQTSTDPFWADVYDGRFGHVYFGHHPFLLDTEPHAFPHATGLDLGCVFGNRLAGIIVETREIFFVPSKGKFAEGPWEE